MFVYFLFELSNTFNGMFKDLGDLGIITSFPFRSPANLEHFVFTDEISMDVSEVEGICSILGNILHVYIDIMDGLTHIAIIFTELSAICHHEVRLD